MPANLLIRRRPRILGSRPTATPPRSGRRPCALERRRPRLVAIDWTLARALRTARFWWIALGYFGGLFVWYAVQVHQTKYLIETGFGTREAALALGVVSLAGVPGQIALGWLSDRVGRELVWLIGCAGFALAYGALLLLEGCRARRCCGSWCWCRAHRLRNDLGLGAIPAEISRASTTVRSSAR